MNGPLVPNCAQFESDAAWRQFWQESRTHPLTAERIQAIANTLNQMAPEFVAPTETNPAAAIETVRSMDSCKNCFHGCCCINGWHDACKTGGIGEPGWRG